MSANVYSKISRLLPGILLAVIVGLGSALTVATSMQKEDLHIDETYSYILSNSHDADRISSDDSVWGQWVPGERFLDFVTVSDGEQFDYGTVYCNNTKDAHPPLYYFLLHTVCSLFPDSFSVWYGIGLNILFTAIALVLLYLCGREVVGRWWALVPVALWAGSAVCVDSTMFIRMYALLGLWTAALSLLIVRAWRHGLSAGRIAGMAAVVFLGVFTQYYFAVFAFYLCLAFGIHLLAKKDVKGALAFGLSAIAAVVLVFVVYPAGITQITGSETNNIGNEVFQGGALLDFSQLVHSAASMALQLVYLLCHGLLAAKIAVALAGIGFLVALAIRLRSKSTAKSARNAEALRLGTVGLAVFVLAFVTIAHISKSFSYVRYVYSLVPFGALALTAFVRGAIPDEGISRLACTGLLCIAAIAFAGNAISPVGTYLFKQSDTSRQVEAAVEDAAVVMVTPRTTYIPTSNLWRLAEAERVLLITEEELDGIDGFMESSPHEGSFVLFIATDQDWHACYDAEEVMQKIESSSSTSLRFEPLGQQSFCEVYSVNTAAGEDAA